jgi:hypothetical protein
MAERTVRSEVTRATGSNWPESRWTTGHTTSLSSLSPADTRSVKRETCAKTRPPLGTLALASLLRECAGSARVPSLNRRDELRHRRKLRAPQGPGSRHDLRKAPDLSSGHVVVGQVAADRAGRAELSERVTPLTLREKYRSTVGPLHAGLLPTLGLTRCAPATCRQQDE